jgi:hypothetical protein
LRPDELWVLFRNEKGFTQARKAEDMKGIREFMDQGAKLGNLWMEGYFDAGDPLTNAGDMKVKLLRRKLR